MEDLLRFILEKIVQHPEDLRIEREEDREKRRLLFRISSHSEDTGLIIGKEGRIIKAIRSLLNVRAAPEQWRVELQINNSEETEAAPKDSSAA